MTLKIWKSLTATSISAITMMGMPSEYYTFGSTVAWGLIAEFIGNFHIFLRICALRTPNSKSKIWEFKKVVDLLLGFMSQFITIWE